METPTIKQQIEFIMQKKAHCNANGFTNRAFMYDSIAQSLFALSMFNAADENESKKQQLAATQEEIDEDLNEIANWFGGFKELKERVNLLEENDQQAAYDRAYDPERQ